MAKDGIYHRMVDDEWRKVKIEKEKVYFENEKGEFVETPFPANAFNFSDVKKD